MPRSVDVSARAPAPAAPTEPARADGEPTGTDGDRSGGPPEPDAAVERLRALLRAPEPWYDRVRDVVGRLGALPRSTRLAAAAVAAVAGLGVGAFVVVGPGAATSVDPARVLPRVDAASARVEAPPANLGSIAPDTASVGDPSPPDPSPPAPIVVHAAGAVAEPGIHAIGPDARVADLISAAGGLTADADPNRVNLAAPLTDGERVYIPRIGEDAVPDVVAGGTGAGVDGDAGTTSSPGSPPARVDLNTADSAALEALPGIGPATAAAIIGHRREHGPFATVDELQDVAGIGPAKLAKLRDLVRV